MASLKELRNRISSVKSTQKITRAMQMVAAAKLHRAQARAEQSRPYAQRMDSVMANLSEAMRNVEGASPLLVGTGQDKAHLVVVATADRGLCGGFNASISRAARDYIQDLQAQGKDVKIVCAGKKGYDVLRRLFPRLILEKFDVGASGASFDVAEQISNKVQALFDEGQFDVATLFYAEFKSVISQEVQKQQLIPAILPEAEGESEDKINLGGAIYEYEPDEEHILEALLPRYITTQVFRALIENAASEQGARMTAMDNATRNAGEMIDSLTLKYNRERQAIITKELIEIISGAEAL